MSLALSFKNVTLWKRLNNNGPHHPTRIRCNKENHEDNHPSKPLTKRLADSIGVSMGPISLSFSDDFENGKVPETVEENGTTPKTFGKCIHSMTTAEWRDLYEKDGTVDLWLKEEFNAASRLTGGRDAHFGNGYGIGTGEGTSRGNVPVHQVQIHNRYTNQIVEVEVPEDRYVMWEAEAKGFQLPNACRNGCCTACTVRIISGEMYQPEALGISKALKDRGYALMCVGYPLSDLVLETVEEDEAYDLQFGRVFAEQALKKTGPNIRRDDFALELAEMDE